MTAITLAEAIRHANRYAGAPAPTGQILVKSRDMQAIAGTLRLLQRLLTVAYVRQLGGSGADVVLEGLANLEVERALEVFGDDGAQR